MLSPQRCAAARIVRRASLEAIAWQQQRLVFHDRTLVEIASEFNRYNRTKLTVIDPRLHTRRYSGTFDTDDPRSFAAYVETDLSINVDETATELQIRMRAH